MFLSPSALCGAALAASSLFTLAHAADCETGPFAQRHAIGDTKSAPGYKDYVPWCTSQWDAGVPVTGLDVWYDENQGINALQLSYANGDRHPIFGVPGSSPQHRSIDWEYSKTFVDSFSLWGNGGGAQLGNIRMVLTDGREFDVGNRNDGRSKKTEFPIDVGAGVMLGAAGWATDNIKQATFLFLRGQIDHITMTDPVFDDSPENLNAQEKGIQLQTVAEVDHANAVNATISWDWSDTITLTTSTTTTTSVTKTFGTAVAITWEASLLAFSVGGGVELSYEYAETNERVETKETSIERTIGQVTPVAPGTHVYCRADAKMGSSDLGFTATVTVHLRGGEGEWSWSEKGTYSQVAWSKASSRCQEKPFSNARRAVEWHG